MKTERKLRLGLFLYNTGHHIASWRHPEADAGLGSDIARYVRLARTAERGLFDLLFLADANGIRERGSAEVMSRSDHAAHLEPLTLLSALAMCTENIGLLGSASTTYNEPYHLARKLASLDHISGGRAGWNLVTSFTNVEARNFGSDSIPAHDDRYRRALEFVEVTQKLWDTWDDDAFIVDKSSGIFFRTEGLRPAAHTGKHFSVLGGLNVPRSPQAYPVIFEAGSSGIGQDVAAATADGVFTVQETLATAQAFYKAVKDKAAALGRAREEILLMPGIFPVIGRTRQEAQERVEQLNALIYPALGLELLQTLIGHDLSDYDVDGPLPDLPQTNGQQTRSALLIGMAKRENLTIRQLYERNAISRGHFTVVGTASDVADNMEEWLLKEAADGFNVLPPVLATDLNLFVDEVVPELQRRGIFRTQYESRTLRGNLGLRRPSNQYASKGATGVTSEDAPAERSPAPADRTSQAAAADTTMD